MGLFDLVRELRDAAATEAREAEDAAADIESHTALSALAWSRVGEPGFVDKLYAAVATDDPALALGLARVRSANDETVQILCEQGLGALDAWLASRVGTTDKQRALTLMLRVRDRLEHRVAGLEALAGVDTREGILAAALLASLPFEDTRAFVAERVSDWAADRTLHLRLRLAQVGHASQDAWLLEQVQALAQARRSQAGECLERETRRYVRREEDAPTATILRVAGERKLEAAVPALIDLLYSHEGLAALGALGAIGAIGDVDGARAAVERYLDSLGGDPRAVAPYRLAAENALSDLGAPQPVDTARFVLETLQPKRYGYPKRKHLEALHHLAAEALLARGDRPDWERLRALACHDDRRLRELGKQAHHKLGEAPPRLTFYDPPAVQALLADSGPSGLLEALRAPGGVFRHNLVTALKQLDDPEVTRSLATMCRAELESLPTPYIASIEVAPQPARAMLYFLKRLSDEDKQELLGGSSCAWIETFVLADSKPIPALPTSVLADGIEVEIERFDSTAPFTIGAQVNGLAVSPDGRHLAVLGGSFCKLLDAESGAHRRQLIPGWSWGYGAAFTPDSRTLLTCFHAGHVESYDVASGERIREFPGHGGVPNGVKRLALSRDGEVLVTVGQDARVMASRVSSGERLWLHQAEPGSYEAVAFSPDESQVVASHVKTGGGEENFLTIHDVQTGSATRVDRDSSMWALAFSPDGRTVAMGGEADDVLLCERDFEPRQRLELGKVTKLRYSPDGEWLYAISESGVLKRFAADGSEPQGATLLEGAGALYALWVGPEQVLCAGKDGTLYRFDAQGERVLSESTLASHRKQVRLLRRVGDRIYSGSWDGQLIRWPLTGQGGEVVYAGSPRICCGEVDATRALLGTGDGLVALDPTSGEVEWELEGQRVDAVAVVEGGVLASQRKTFVLLEPGAEAFPEERIVAGTDSLECLRVLPNGDLLVSTEAGEVSRYRGKERLWTIVDHGEDKLEYGSPHNAVFDMLLTADGFISAGNDNTVRVYRLEDPGPPELLKRIHCPGLGIFNRLSLSSDERLLAIPTGSRLEVYALPSAERRVSLASLEHFANSSVTAALFLDADELLVGTENGSLYRVRLEGAR